MATLGTDVFTLADWAKRIDPDGKVDAIVELLEQKNEILMDQMWREGNLPTGELLTVRTGLPTAYWRLLNKGTPNSTSQTAQITETLGILEAWSELDEDMATLGGNLGSLRLSEAKAFIEAMGQEQASTLFYGNVGLNQEEFTGLSVRYSDLGAANGSNIIDGGGTGSDNMSMWLVSWGADRAYGIFPKGSKAGLVHNDIGLDTILDSDGNKYRAYQDQYKWKSGLAIKDWRYVVRMANIDTSDLVANAGSEAALREMMTKAWHRLPDRRGKLAYYVNRTTAEFLDIQATASVSSGGGVRYENVDGQPTLKFRGIPVRTCDALLETEARVI